MTVQAQTPYCVSCKTNEINPWWKDSLPFTHEITPIDCSKYVFLTTPPPTPHKKIVPNTIPTPKEVVLFGNSA